MKDLYCIKCSVFFGGSCVVEENLSKSAALGRVKEYSGDVYEDYYVVPQSLANKDYDYDGRL